MTSRSPERRSPRLACLLLACAAALFDLDPAGADEAQPAPPPVSAAGYRAVVQPREEWVVELRLGGRSLNPGLIAIERDGELLLPLGQLAESFELALGVEADRARATGFVIHPDRPFELDLARGVLHIEEVPRSLDDARIVIASREIYVDPRTLSRWLPVDLEVLRRSLRVEARSREPLPVEKRLERERIHRRLGSRPLAPDGSARRLDYRWWSRPALDVNLRSRVQRPAGRGGHDWTTQYDVAAAGDLLKLHTELLFTGVDARSLRLRARAGRRDPDGRLWGPLGVHEFTLGDVYTPAYGQISSGRSGRGLQVSSFPFGHLNELGQVTLEGDLQPGYQVELYRDDILLDVQSGTADLRYRFEDVPTLPGLNVIRLVFYGPRGEVREEVRRLWSDGGIAEPGETRFRLTANQHDEDSLTLGERPGDDRLRGDPRVLAELEHGLAEDLTLAVGAASIPLLEGQHHYGSLALRSEVDGHLMRTEAFASHDGGLALGSGWQTRLGPVSLGLSHHEFRRFLSERTRQHGGEQLRGRTEATLEGRGPWRAVPLSYRLVAGHSRLAGGDSDVDGALRLSAWLRPIFLTHTLRGRLDQEVDTQPRTVNGDLLASYRRRHFGLRGRFLYSALPQEAEFVSLIGDWTPNDLLSARLGVTHTFGDRTALLASLSRRLGAFVLSADVTVDRDGVASASVGLSFGAIPDAFTGGARWHESGATRSGAVAARAFLDRNANGRFDPGDEALEDVGFVGARGVRTAPDGTALLTRLPADLPTAIALDAHTVHDPHWLVPEGPERVILRPGTPVRIDFPVVPVGEIDGWVLRERDGERHPLAGITLLLRDEQGEVAATARSAIDGFYVFQEILPGRYWLSVDPDQAGRLGLVAPVERQLVIEHGGSVLSDQSFVLRAP